MNDARSIYDKIQQELRQLPLNDFMLSAAEENQLRSQKMAQIIRHHLQESPQEIQDRVLAEINSWGPLENLMQDEEISEIMVNGPQSVWFEKKGVLHSSPDSFFSDVSYRNFLERLSHTSKAHITTEYPCADGSFADFRVSLIGGELTQNSPHLTLRRHPKNPWNFDRLAQAGWCHSELLPGLKQMITRRRNFLVVGSTGAGKTSVLNAFMQMLPANERVVVIEDTPEIALPNSASMKLITREDPQGVMPSVDQAQLVRRSLRLRPDRLVMGEVRGPEAKDFLMALATGHAGSFGTLHAQDAAQALIRLEMLIQMGAPQWNLTAIRRLIQMSLEFIIVTERKPSGLRGLKGIYRICSLEENGFLLEQES